jgi:hypothetical protein
MPSVIDLSEAFGREAAATCMRLKLALFAHNDQKDQPLGTPTQVVLHWTAGTYAQCWDSYHFNIAFDAKAPRACVVKALSLKQKGQHLAKRNTGAIGVTLCAMASKSHPVQPLQEAAAAELCAELLWHHKLSIAHLTDHAHWARVDGYFPHRWDVGDRFAAIRALTEARLRELQAGERKPAYTHLFT